MTENPYKTMTFDELKAVYADIQESEKNGRRADSLLPYAKELREKIGANEISLRETLDIAKKEYYEEVARRYFYVSRTQSMHSNDRKGDIGQSYINC